MKERNEIRKKESIEWLRIWCADTGDELPRVALIGDSITEHENEVVKRELAGIAKVDYLVTSYAITSPAYLGMVEKFIEDTDYALICYNYGLHGRYVTADAYEATYRKLLELFSARSKVVISLSTIVHDKNDLNVEDQLWTPLVLERNARATALAKEFGFPIDDSYTISVRLSKDGKLEDGVHFNGQGKEALGVNKAQVIKKALQVGME